jgi:hypothetical protein
MTNCLPADNFSENTIKRRADFVSEFPTLSLTAYVSFGRNTPNRQRASFLPFSIAAAAQPSGGEIGTLMRSCGSGWVGSHVCLWRRQWKVSLASSKRTSRSEHRGRRSEVRGHKADDGSLTQSAYIKATTGPVKSLSREGSFNH